MAKAKHMSLIDHLNELRKRIMVIVIILLIATIVCFVYSGPMLAYLTQGITLIYIRPPEAMMAHIRIAFTAGLAISSPLIFYQIIAFMFPALTGKEKKVLLVAVIMMFILFGLGVMFAWLVAFPFAINFFASFASQQLMPYYTASEYVSFVSGLLLGFGLVFQLPLLFWLLGALGLISTKFLRTSRKYALIIILIIAAIATPPDVVSQVLMAIPMLALYELGIILVAMTERKKKKRLEES